eukprot:TRINITY_DN3901_c0_g3_i5.p1 TRINITY_DN3901_c0_g3~~TRINITY_DN3901_c0_g3_i5.p1  ORF type:complete len:490 (+),score=112.15 TRINITY_DN3901_c0_g3_i5:830-2299(+)
MQLPKPLSKNQSQPNLPKPSAKPNGQHNGHSAAQGKNGKPGRPEDKQGMPRVPSKASSIASSGTEGAHAEDTPADSTDEFQSLEEFQDSDESDVEADLSTNPLLKHKWVFWEHRELPKGGGPDSAYHHAIGYVGECKTVGDFWRVFNNIPAPSKFFSRPPKQRGSVGGRNVEGWSLFRHGVQPEWEDPKNATGSELTVSSETLDQCDDWWESLLCALIGNVLPFGDELTGVRVIDKCRKGSKPVYRLELWFTCDCDVKSLKTATKDVLDGFEGNFKLKQHSTQKPIAKSVSHQSLAGNPEAPTVETMGRVKELRALLAKLTPDAFTRLVPQVQGLLGDGNKETVAATVQCIKLCTMQTNIFHGMYADLVQALVDTPGVQTGAVSGCLQQLRSLNEDNRLDAKNAASFAAELCARGVMRQDQMRAALSRFVYDDLVNVEVLCTLLKTLQPVKSMRQAVDPSLKDLTQKVRDGALPPRIRFMIEDLLKLYR